MHPFDLCWQEWVEEPFLLPSLAGLYCVWAAPLRPDAKGTPVISPKEAQLVFIGQTSNLRSQIGGHEKWTDWQTCCQPGESLVFTYSLLPVSRVSEARRRSLENCLIATYRPRCNDVGLKYECDRGVVIRNSGVTFDRLLGCHCCRGAKDPDDW